MATSADGLGDNDWSAIFSGKDLCNDATCESMHGVVYLLRDMENSQGDTLADLRWIPLDGEWEREGADGLVFTGGEYDPPESEKSPAVVPEGTAKEPAQKFINFGTALFDRHFKEGQIEMQVEFDEVDHRSSATIVIQYDPATKDMLTFGASGGGLKYKPGVSGYLFKLMLWASPPQQQQQQGTTTSTAPGKVWTPLFEVGLGINLKPKRPYDLEVSVRGSVVTLRVDSVEIGKQILPIPSLAGNPCGIFCGSHSKIGSDRWGRNGTCDVWAGFTFS